MRETTPLEFSERGHLLQDGADILVNASELPPTPMKKDGLAWLEEWRSKKDAMYAAGEKMTTPEETIITAVSQRGNSLVHFLRPHEIAQRNTLKDAV